MFSFVFIFGLFLSGLAIASTDANIMPPDVLMPGTIEGTGTHFEVNDSEYLNVVLDSSESITLRLESIPEMVTMHVDPASSATSTQITISGFKPLATYYKYEDNYHNLNEFTTDVNGSYSWTQDLSQSHLVFIQPRKSTKFIADNATGGDCYLIGTWDSATKTCTLTTDVYETIQIDSNYITLDGNGHAVIGTGTGYGIYLSRRAGIIIKNLTVTGFFWGSYLYYSDNNIFIGNTVSNRGGGIYIFFSNNNTFKDNTALNGAYGFMLQASSNNTLIDNRAQENFLDLYVIPYIFRPDSSSFCNNIIQNTTGSGGRPIKFFNTSVNLQDEVLSELILCNADYSNISNVTIEGSATLKNNGLIIWNTDYSNISNATSSNSWYGILLMYSSNNALMGNTTSNNPSWGIFIGNSTNNSLTNNITSNNPGGIILSNSSSTLTGNTVLNNGNGLSLSYASNTQIYNNNFINNGVQAYVWLDNNTIFNLDAPTGGNYWSDFDTPDEGCYDTNTDGFCNAPYYFNGGVDYLPWTRQSGWEKPTMESLMILIQQLLQSGGIDNAGIANSLLSKVSNAIEAENSGNEQASDNIMQAFINQVSAQAGQHISQDAAAILMNAAAYIINN
ncbi:MAG: NosD domain-containing protein [Thermodesulfovibrionales bacterium]